jgi:hypothetical protein
VIVVVSEHDANQSRLITVLVFLDGRLLKNLKMLDC